MLTFLTSNEPLTEYKVALTLAPQGRYSTKFYTGEHYSKVQPVTLLDTIFGG